MNNWRQEAKELLSKISPYPWKIILEKEGGDWAIYGIEDATGWKLIETDTGVYPPHIDDANFITKSPELIAKYEEQLAKAEKIFQDFLDAYWFEPSEERGTVCNFCDGGMNPINRHENDCILVQFREYFNTKPKGKDE